MSALCGCSTRLGKSGNSGGCCKNGSGCSVDERHLMSTMTSQMSSLYDNCNLLYSTSPLNGPDDVICLPTDNDSGEGGGGGDGAAGDAVVDYTTVPLYRAMRSMFVSMRLCGLFYFVTWPSPTNDSATAGGGKRYIEFVEFSK